MNNFSDGCEILTQGHAGLCEVYYDNTLRAESLKEHLPGEQAFRLASRMLKATGDPVRVKLLYALTHSELCSDEMAYLTGMSLSCVLRHVRVLMNTGLIQRRKVGRLVFYRLQEAYLTGAIERIVNSCREKAGH